MNVIGLVHYGLAASFPGKYTINQTLFQEHIPSHLPNLVNADWKNLPGDLSQSERAKSFE